MSSHDGVSTLDHGVERPFSGLMTAQTALALFDEIEFGLIVCDEWGGIHFANHAAQQEMASQRLLLRSGNALCGVIGSTGNVGFALRQAVQCGLRCLVRLGKASDHLMVSVLPFHLHGVETGQALVVLGRRYPCSELGLEMLAGSYGLTWAERRVLGALVRHATPREIASAHAVKLSTVRTQISSIRAKFGTRNIEGLLLRAAQVPPVPSALRLTGMSRACASAALLQAA